MHYRTKKPVFRDKYYEKGEKVFIDEKKEKVDPELYEKIDESKEELKSDKPISGGDAEAIKELKAHFAAALSTAKTEIAASIDAIQEKVAELVTEVEDVAKRVKSIEDAFDAVDEDEANLEGGEDKTPEGDASDAAPAKAAPKVASNKRAAAAS